MRVLLILVLLLPIVVFAAWFATAEMRRQMRSRRHTEEILEENERLDALLEDDLERHRRVRQRR